MKDSTLKILLVEHPRTVSAERCNDIANTPLSSCLHSGYVAGMLQSKGHEVEIVEGFLDRLSYRELDNRISAFKPDLLGVHMVYHWQNDSALFAFLEQVKAKKCASYITVYGFYPTMAAEDILGKCQAVDSVILGEPEFTFAELAAAVSGGVNQAEKSSDALINPERIPGLALRDESGKIVSRRRELAENLDEFPFPVRTEAMLRMAEVNLLGSRGCYGGCTFCYINPFYGQGSRWRARSPENIVAEIDSIIAATGKRDFYFTDPNFFGPGPRGQERALRLASLLKSRNIRFGIEARVNDIHEETVAALVEAGLRDILIGLESGRDESLQRLNKMTTVAQNERAIQILRRHGIEPNVGFIMFEPDSSLDDVRTNYEFLKRNELLKNLTITANVLYHDQILLKGTPAYQKLKEEGRLQTDPSLSYEGTTSIADPKVAALAKMMREITNFIFEYMDGIWSGKLLEPIGAREKYEEANSFLVETFESSLKTLEAGDLLTDQQIDLLVKEAITKIREMLPGSLEIHKKFTIYSSHSRMRLLN
ncbi:B12-binding domain-containing radical SAM protein [Paradesulfitobacterium ferrireducens]|uniref:B12-binding domain-containing radical SAM protein n=1 Tax=Paradesulfitobacterium ferrireducens TaxID=2816476 RepID=UPI001F1CF121|nr:radical SAM protein [Paradesulfitobacterium ferrireducens]